MTKNMVLGIINLAAVLLMTSLGIFLSRPQMGTAIILLASALAAVVPPLLTTFAPGKPRALRRTDRRGRLGWMVLIGFPVLGAIAIISTAVVQGLNVGGAMLLALAGVLALTISLVRVSGK